MAAIQGASLHTGQTQTNSEPTSPMDDGAVGVRSPEQEEIEGMKPLMENRDRSKCLSDNV